MTQRGYHVQFPMANMIDMIRPLYTAVAAVLSGISLQVQSDSRVQEHLRAILAVHARTMIAMSNKFLEYTPETGTLRFYAWTASYHAILLSPV